jgi:hypothetical protein
VLTGAVIVGSVDGNRIWGKELRGGPLTAVEVCCAQNCRIMFLCCMLIFKVNDFVPYLSRMILLLL